MSAYASSSRRAEKRRSGPCVLVAVAAAVAVAPALWNKTTGADVDAGIETPTASLAPSGSEILTFVAPGGGAHLRASPRDSSAVIREYGRGWREGQQVARKGARGGAALTMGGGKKKKKKGETVKEEKILPKIHRMSPVIYNGKKVAELNGTISEYKVDIWSGAHPIWQGKKGKVMLDASSVTKFQERFQSMSDIFGDIGIEQLKNNERVKKEMEERKKAGLKVY
mmetsp:Transcript_28791/g.79336  ORF Transcript_28791/g.79336 Transcript_28791/m.79336 type:complete len:225 (+) Transcript_28791:147-821(+)